MAKTRLPAALTAIALAILLGRTDAPLAREYLRADLAISASWARASMAKTAEAFLTIENKGAEPERLLAISSPVAKRVELQRYEGVGGINGPRRIESVEIPPGKSITLAPTETVISLIGLKQPLREGESVTLTLTFEHAGAVSVFASVLDAGTLKPPRPKDKSAKSRRSKTGAR